MRQHLATLVSLRIREMTLDLNSLTDGTDLVGGALDDLRAAHRTIGRIIAEAERNDRKAA